jgi:hypothetical protein
MKHSLTNSAPDDSPTEGVNSVADTLAIRQDISSGMNNLDQNSPILRFKKSPLKGTEVNDIDGRKALARRSELKNQTTKNLELT